MEQIFLFPCHPGHCTAIDFAVLIGRLAYRNNL
jgi:hypothetical protein